jgi:hypothetical protein
VQVPLEHDDVPCGMEQATPQAPQWVVVLSCVSQPFGALVSQLPQPASQLGTQAKLPGEPWHGFVPCDAVQALLQLAQLVAVPSGVSQPGLPMLQSAYPEVHAPMLQLTVEPDSVQVAAAFAKEHAVLQLPQSVSVTTLRSQPLSGLLSQLL